jgi:hypothetical protein
MWGFSVVCPENPYIVHIFQLHRLIYPVVRQANARGNGHEHRTAVALSLSLGGLKQILYPIPRARIEPNELLSD